MFDRPRHPPWTEAVDALHWANPPSNQIREVIGNHSSPEAVFSITVTSELSITMHTRFLTAAAVAGALALAPVANAAEWHRDWHGNYHHGGGNAAGAAIVGGIVGLGVGAAIASGGYSPYYYAPPPPVYYGSPYSYYAPPPAVYYGY
jgi:hypothetical protein